MTPRFLVALAAVLLAGCAMVTRPSPSAAPAGPLSCGGRDFNVYFEGQSTELSADARAVIDATGAGLNGCRIDQVRIIGSTDVSGGERDNEEISKLRAKTMADYLEDHFHWPRDHMVLMVTGERGAVTDEGLNVPMRRRARIVVEASAP